MPTLYEIEKAKITYEELNSNIQQSPLDYQKKRSPKTQRVILGALKYGFDQFYKLFNNRQLFSLGILIKVIRESRILLSINLYEADWVLAINAYLATSLIDY